MLLFALFLLYICEIETKEGYKNVLFIVLDDVGINK